MKLCKPCWRSACRPGIGADTRAGWRRRDTSIDQRLARNMQRQAAGADLGGGGPEWAWQDGSACTTAGRTSRAKPMQLTQGAALHPCLPTQWPLSLPPMAFVAVSCNTEHTHVHVLHRQHVLSFPAFMSVGACCVPAFVQQLSLSPLLRMSACVDCCVP